MPKLVDRIDHAVELARGKRVLDIGGEKMPNCQEQSPFARAYARIEEAAADYRILDYQQSDTVDYVLDLNQPASMPKLASIFDEFRPEVILCMETLEHINYHFEVMQEMAGAVSRHGSTVFITVPNNGNWVFNYLGWNVDHSVAFFRDIAERFVTRSDLGQHEVTLHPCMQKYLWYWPLVYLASFGQPFNWGFTIRPKPPIGS